MRIKYEFAGIARSEKHLCVFFEIVTGSARRVECVMVPWVELIDMNTLSYIDKAVRAELERTWADREDNADEEIPGIG
uniref:Uncharacterized protein n=1 Tax=uncultured prokaryote TaxID=198431 RepID=A0A0H5Q5W5_9ZZZZ|nr:hypothetical protein [uncultured prokaryote]